MRLIGVGLTGIKLFCSVMDLTQDFKNARYYGMIENIKIAVKTVYDMVLKKASMEEKKILKEKNLPRRSLYNIWRWNLGEKGVFLSCWSLDIEWKILRKASKFICSCKKCNACTVHKKK